MPAIFMCKEAQSMYSVLIWGVGRPCPGNEGMSTSCVADIRAGDVNLRKRKCSIEPGAELANRKRNQWNAMKPIDSSVVCRNRIRT